MSDFTTLVEGWYTKQKRGGSGWKHVEWNEDPTAVIKAQGRGEYASSL